MLVATQGIVLKSLKFQESSLIVKMFTASHGVQTFMIKGVRSVKANGKAGMFQSGMLLDIIMYYQEHKSFKMLKEYRAAHVYTSSLYDIRKSSVLLFLVEVLEQCIHDDNEDELLFSFIYKALIDFDTQAFLPNFHIHFLLELMQYLGIYPGSKRSLALPYFDIKEGGFSSKLAGSPFVLNEQDSILMSHVLSPSDYTLDRNERKKVVHLILDYFSFHIDNFRGIKSLQVLETVLS